VPRPYRTKLTPEQLSERARKAGQVSQSLDTTIKRIVDRAPELSEAQRARLAAIFAPATGGRAA
jgi:hypothetical protein